MAKVKRSFYGLCIYMKEYFGLNQESCVLRQELHFYRSSVYRAHKNARDSSAIRTFFRIDWKDL